MYRTERNPRLVLAKFHIKCFVPEIASGIFLRKLITHLQTDRNKYRDPPLDIMLRSRDIGILRPKCDVTINSLLLDLRDTQEEEAGKG